MVFCPMFTVLIYKNQETFGTAATLGTKILKENGHEDIWVTDGPLFVILKTPKELTGEAIFELELVLGKEFIKYFHLSGKGIVSDSLTTT